MTNIMAPFCNLVILTSILVTVLAQSDDEIRIKIEKSKESSIPQKIFYTLGDSNDGIDILVKGDVSFFIIQVHSFIAPVELSNSSTFDKHTYVRGQNIGLVQIVDSKKTDYTFYLKNNITNGKVLIVVTPYTKSDPIPGGCNMIFDVEMAPYQMLHFTSDLITVDAQGASINKHFCEENLVALDMYHYYLNGWDFSEEEFYNGVNKMLNVADIQKNGNKVPAPIGFSKLRRYYSNYLGVGSVYAVVARYKNHTSAYVPIVSYGCDISLGSATCYDTTEFEWLILGSIFITFGLIMLLFSKHYPSVPCFFSISLITITVFYYSIMTTRISVQYVTWTMGIIFVVVLMIILVKCATYINCFIAAYIYTSLLFFSNSIGDVDTFQYPWFYWCVYLISCVFLFITILLINLVMKGFPTGIVAVTFFVLGANRLWGGILYYAFLNNVRHIYVPTYNLAVIDPPLEYKDHVSIWLGILIGVIWWKIQNRCYTSTDSADDSETTPLLA